MSSPASGPGSQPPKPSLDATRRWIEQTRTWEDLVRYVGDLSRREKWGAFALAGRFWVRQCGLVLAGIVLISAVIDALGVAGQHVPRWAQLFALACVAISLPIEVRGAWRGRMKWYAMMLVAVTLAMIVGIPWWVTWGIAATFIGFSWPSTTSEWIRTAVEFGATFATVGYLTRHRAKRRESSAGTGQ